MKTVNLHWADEFICKIKPFVFVRTEDNILIKRPNVAAKINPTGAKVLKYLLNGGTTTGLLKKTGKEKAGEIDLFLRAVKSYLEGNLDEFSLNPAVERESFSLRFSRLPILSELALTYQCNLKCLFCYAGCNCTVNPAGTNEEMTPEQFRSVIRSIYCSARVPSISFTGGEPTLRPELLLDCIEYAHELGMRVNLITNGTRIDADFGKKLKKAGLDSAQVSLEGTNPEMHDRIVQVKGAFEKSMRSISIFKDLDIHVHTNTTLNRMNAEDCLHLPAFVKNALRLDRFSMNLVIPAGSSIVHDELVISYQDAGKMITAIQNESKLQGIEFMWYSPIPLCMFNTITSGLGNKGCAACDGLLSIAPDGEVLPCASYDHPVGNLNKMSFNEIWNSEEAVYFRNKNFAHPICRNCEHLAVCNGACPLYWRNMGYDELYQTQQKKYEPAAIKK